MLRLLGFLTLLLVLGGAWLYRDDLVPWVRTHLPGAAVADAGRPGDAAVETADRKVERVARGRADSVVLSPDEFASLLAEALDRTPLGEPDSLRVRFGEGEVEVSGKVRTSFLGDVARGALARVLDSVETVRVAGGLGLLREGVGELRVTRVRVAELPMPAGVVARLMPGGGGGGTWRFRLPTGITGLRVRPGGVTLYGRARN